MYFDTRWYEWYRVDTMIHNAENYFHTGGGLRINAADVIDTIRAFMSERPESSYKIIIGTDSLGVNDSYTDFVTAIVVQRVGNGGKYFWKRLSRQHVYGLRDRIIKEVMLTLETATDVLKLLKEHPELTFDFEVHVDVGMQGKTSALISEVTGMIRGYNFPFKTKPESYAASNIADKHV